MLNHLTFQGLLHSQIKLKCEPAYEDNGQTLVISSSSDLTDEILLSIVTTKNIQKLAIRISDFTELTSLSAFNHIQNFDFSQTSITQIPLNCFKGLKNIKNIVLTSSATSIGAYAFASSSIESVTASQIVSIDDHAFYRCSNLATINLSHAQHIKDFAFTESGLTSATLDSLQEITYAFYKCDKLTTITLPETIEIMNSQLDSTSIKTITLFNIGYKFYIDSLVELTSTGTECHIGYSLPKLEKVKLTNPDLFGVSIANQMVLHTIELPDLDSRIYASFTMNPKLTTVTNGKSIRYLSTAAFAGCTSLETIDLSNVNQFTPDMFLNCYSLKTIHGFNDVESSQIELYGAPFRNCWSLKITEITEGKFNFYYSDKTISNAFAYTGIEDLTIKYYPETGLYFYGCKNLKRVDMSQLTGKPYLPKYMFRDCINLDTVIFPDEVTSIHYFAFENTKLTTLNLKNIQFIGVFGFSNCNVQELTMNYNFKIPVTESFPDENVEMPDKMVNYDNLEYEKMINYERINDGNDYPNDHMRYYVTPFWNCKKLRKITLGSEVTSFSLRYFPNSTITEIVLDNNNNNNFVVENYILYDTTKTIIYAYFNTQSTEFTVPDTVQTISPFALAYSPYETITVPKQINIINGLFAFCHNLKTVTFEGKINRLGDDTFSHCYNLETINFAEGSSLISIGHECFICCYKLSSLPSMENAISLRDYSFAYCTSLTSISIPKVNTIPSFCFWHSNIAQFTLSTTLSIVKDNAFNSTKIQSFACPVTLVYIGVGAFANCIKLTSFTYNENNKITAILQGTFSNTSLTRFKIPNTITYLHPTSFKGSYKIDFEFEAGGHPLFTVDNNCFIEKNTGLLIFTFGKLYGTYKLSDKVTRIHKNVIIPERVVKDTRYIIKQGITTLIVPQSVKSSYDYKIMTLEGEEFPQSVFLENLCFEGEEIEGWRHESGRPSLEYDFQIYVTENFIKESHNINYDDPYGCVTEKISLMRPNVFEAANGNYPKTFKLSSDIYQNKNTDVIATGYIFEFWNVPNAQRILKAIFRFLNLNNGLEITLFALVMVLSAIIAILTALLTRL